MSEAERQLVRKLQDKELRAIGQKKLSSDEPAREPEPIPDTFWCGEHLVICGDRAFHELDHSRDQWYEIMVGSKDIRRLWPRPLLDLASREGAMNAFEKPYWSRLQVELWVCTRSREAVRLAECAPGSTRLLDLDDDDHGPVFDDETELIGTVIGSYGYVCSFDDARRERVVAQADGRLRAYPDPYSHSEFLKREDVLALWPDPLRQSARTEPLTVAEAVAQLIRGRSSRKPVSERAWQRLRRRHGGKFPGPIGRAH